MQPFDPFEAELLALACRLRRNPQTMTTQGVFINPAESYRLHAQESLLSDVGTVPA